MEEFKKALQRQRILLVSGLLCACAAICLSARFFEKEATTSDFASGYISGFQVGVTVFLLGILVVFIAKHTLALRNPAQLKKLYIATTDERQRFIKQKTGSIGLNVISYGLIVSTAVAGNINDTVFFSLLGACLFVVTVQGFLKLYYRNKY